MIKGHVQIDLHNHRTGLKDRIEQDNMVTNAIPKIVEAYAKNGRMVFENTNLTPLATVGLGGLFLFDNTLTENADNYLFPSEAKFVACAGDYVDTTSPLRGSKNAIETGWVDDDTYLHVWDFNTSQANGVIKSLSLTHKDAGANPSNHLLGIETYGNGSSSTDDFGVSFDYDDLQALLTSNNGDYPKMLYMTEKHLQDIPISMSFSNIKTEEALVQIPKGSWSGNGRTWHSAVKIGGYVYFTYDTSFSSYSTNYAYINIGKLDLSTFSVTYGLLGSDLYYGNYSASGLAYANGYLYLSTWNGLNVYDPSDMSLVKTISVASYGSKLSSFNGCIFVLSQGKIVYPDDSVVSIPGTSDLGRGLHNTRDGMACFRNNTLYVYKNYLGTICNLAQPVEKTSELTMKVKYTITNAE